MRNDSRLPRVLHTLLHLAQRDVPATSELIAQMLGTNSSVMRRTMSGLRDAGILTSVKGHGGGWSLNKPLDQITLLDVYEALGTPQIFSIGAVGRGSQCLLEQAADNVTEAALSRASEAFRAELANVTVAQIADEFTEKMKRVAPYGLTLE